MTDYIAEDIRRALMERPQKMLSNLIMMIEHGRLPEILTLEEIGLLSGYSEPYRFVEFIKTTALEIIDVDGLPSATRDAYEAYLKQIGKWPADSNLASWWNELQPHEEAMASAGAGGKGGTEQTISKVIQSNKNEFEFSGLLNIPSKVDAWFRVIDDMTRNFHTKHKAIPNETKAWISLWTEPPAGYAITTGKDKGEDCLMMPGVRPLGKRSFDERWKKYTSTISG